MRARRLMTVLGCLALLGAGAQADAKGRDRDVLELPEKRKDFIYLTDGAGHYIAIEKGRRFEHFYYGDGKSLYQQVVMGSSAGGSNSDRSAYFFAGNVNDKRSRGGDFSVVEDSSWTITCGKDSVEYKPVSSNVRKRLVDKAVFKKPYWKRTAKFLARDSEGRYYFADRLREDYGVGWRVFVGRRGQLKQVGLVDVVTDSGGVVFNLSGADLTFNRLYVNKHEIKYSAYYAGKKNVDELIYVPVFENRMLIYRELGVYPKELGTPCDPLF